MSEPRRLDAQGPATADLVRFEQVVALFPQLFAPDAGLTRLGERIAQIAAVLTRSEAAAVGLVARDGTYRLLAGYGLPGGYAARYRERSLEHSEIGAAFARGIPVLRVEEPQGEAPPLVTYILRFSDNDTAGALHLVGPVVCNAVPDLALGRYLASLAGPAITCARRFEELREASRRKSDCLSAISHDLRAPLNTLVGYLGLMREGTFGPLNAEQTRIAELLERQSLDLADLLTASLDLVCLEAGKVRVRREEFTVARLFEELRRTRFPALKPSTSIEWILEGEIPPLHTDRVKLRETIQNLVDNAARHADADRIEVRARHLPATATVEIVVRDSGRGIPPDELPQLFERLHTGASTRGGTGLGLYLVRRFAEALGGGVKITSRPGAGTTVRVEVPLRAPAS